MTLKHVDTLSRAAMAVLEARPSAYEKLVTTGTGTTEVRQQLQQLDVRDLFCRSVQSHVDARGLLAGLWLWHDFLDESHSISQGLETPTGSFWHAILHRREGDFSNAKYWYARCRNHPVLEEIHNRAAAQAGAVAGGEAAVEQMLRGTWDPNAFVDFVSRVEGQGGGPLHAAAVRLQKIEWAALFDHCILAASGG